MGAWVAQLVKRLPLAQVMTPRVLGWRPASGSLLVGESASPSTPALTCALPLSYSLSLK